jgi:hypothetical protein
MKRGIDCPMCDQQDCGRHDDVLAFVNVLDRCALFGAALLIAAALALALS